MRWKRRGQIDDNNCDERKSKRFCLVSIASKFLETEEAQKRRAFIYYDVSHERNIVNS